MTSRSPFPRRQKQDEGSLAQRDNSEIAVRRRRRTTIVSRTGAMLGLGIGQSSAQQSRDTVTRRRKSTPGVDGSQDALVHSELDELPASLQRVGTRIRHERNVARRMTISKQKRRVRRQDNDCLARKSKRAGAGWVV